MLNARPSIGVLLYSPCQWPGCSFTGESLEEEKTPITGHNLARLPLALIPLHDVTLTPGWVKARGKVL